MDKDKISGLTALSPKDYIITAIVGVLVTTVFIAIFAGVMLALQLDSAFAAPLATVALAFGSFASAFYAARKRGSKGYITGLIVGGAVFLIVLLISLFINKNGISINTLFHFIIIMLSSLIGGVLGVNKRKVKYI